GVPQLRRRGRRKDAIYRRNAKPRHGRADDAENQFVLVGGGEAQSCNVSMSAPYDEVAAAGVTIEADVRWSAQPIDPSSFEISAEERLPTEVPVGGRELAFTRTID